MAVTGIRDVVGLPTPWLALLVLLAALFPRIVVALGAPGIIKFFHFVLAILFCALILPYIWVASTKLILFGLTALLWTIAVSALINGAGIINVLLDFLLLSEPFLLLILIINERMSQSDINGFRAVLGLAVIVHTLLAYYQYFTVGVNNADLVKGLFLEQGAGHHVAGAVALTAAVYFFQVSELSPWILRVFLAGAVAFVVILSDSKQVIVVFVASLVPLLLMNLHDFKRFFVYMFWAVLTIGVGILTAYTMLPGIAFWADIALIQKGIEAKLVVISIVISHYDSSLNWLFGLGPGHTVGRLASLIPDYLEQLKSLGATTSLVTDTTEQQRISNFVSNEKTGSSMWSPFFFWAGIWGDLGIVGCSAYLFLWYIIFRDMCLDKLSHYFVFTIFIFGMVFSWLEEPGYMLFVVALIGLSWQQGQDGIQSKV